MQGFRSGDHCGSMDNRDQHSHGEVAADERAGCLVSAVGVSTPAEPKIDRHQHESRPVSNRHGKGPEAQLCRWGARSSARALERPIAHKMSQRKLCNAAKTRHARPRLMTSKWLKGGKMPE